MIYNNIAYYKTKLSNGEYKRAYLSNLVAKYHNDTLFIVLADLEGGLNKIKIGL